MVNDMHNDVKKYSTLMSGMDKAKTDFVVLCGDIISYAPGADSVMKYTFGPIDDIAASFPVIYARGNHEGRGPEWYDIPKLFPSPTGEFYFSFRQGPVAFLVLDLQFLSPESIVRARAPRRTEKHQFSNGEITFLQYAQELLSDSATCSNNSCSHIILH